MATTHRFFAIPQRAQTRQSFWSKVKAVWKSTKHGLLLAALGCCANPETVWDYDCYLHDRQVRAAICQEIRQHPGFFGRETCVSNAIDEVLTEIGYDLADLNQVRRANAGVTRTESEWDEYFRAHGVDIDRLLSSHTVKVIPKFAAACALHIRAKLGALAMNEANYLLAQRKYLEMCRRHGVRDVDIVAHQGHVLNALFTEGVLDDVAAAKKRLPKWVAWLDDVSGPRALPQQAC